METAKIKLINKKYSLLLTKILITISGILIFLAWLMLITNNFYTKENSSIVDKIISLPIQITIWPVTFIILFIFIMPIWVTYNKKILFWFLIISHTILIGNFYFLFLLNINSFWIYWLIANIISFFIIVFSIFSLIEK